MISPANGSTVNHQYHLVINLQGKLMWTCSNAEKRQRDLQVLCFCIWTTGNKWAECDHAWCSLMYVCICVRVCVLMWVYGSAYMWPWIPLCQNDVVSCQCQVSAQCFKSLVRGPPSLIMSLTAIIFWTHILSLTHTHTHTHIYLYTDSSMNSNLIPVLN